MKTRTQSFLIKVVLAILCVCMLTLVFFVFRTKTFALANTVAETESATVTPVEQELQSNEQPVAQIADVYYGNLLDAFTAAKDMSGDVTITLLDDLDLSEWKSFDLVGATCNSLTFDGNNHKIVKLAQSLFLRAISNSKDIIVKNIDFTAFDINGVSGGDYGNAAGLILPAIDTKKITIENVNAYEGKVTSTSTYAAGLIGWVNNANVIISNCSIHEVEVTGANSSGGLLGHIDAGAIVNVTNTTIGGNTIKVNIDESGDSVKTGALFGTINTASTKIYVDVTETVPSKGYYNINGAGDTYQGEQGDSLKLIGRRYTLITYTGGSYYTNPTESYYKNSNGSVKTGRIALEENKYNVYPMAQIGDKKYATLDDALTAAVQMTGDVVVEIIDTLDLSTWKSFSLSGVKYTSLTIDGKENTITNLGQALLNQAKGIVTVKDLNFKDVAVAGAIDASTVGINAAIISSYVSEDTLIIQNVHVDGGVITANAFAGGFVAYTANKGLVTIDGCSIENVSIYGDTAGGLIGLSCMSPLSGQKYGFIVTNTTVDNLTMYSSSIQPNTCGVVAGIFNGGKGWIDVTESAPSKGYYKPTANGDYILIDKDTTDEAYIHSNNGVYGTDELKVIGSSVTETTIMEFRGGSYYTNPNEPAGHFDNTCKWGTIVAPYVIENSKYVIISAYITDQDGNVVNTYQTLTEAVESAQEGEIVVLWQNVKENFVVDKSITLDLNEASFVGTVTIEDAQVAEYRPTGGYIVDYQNNVNLTIKGTSIDGTNNITLMLYKNYCAFKGLYTDTAYEILYAETAPATITSVTAEGSTYYAKWEREVYSIEIKDATVQETDPLAPFFADQTYGDEVAVSKTLIFTWGSDVGTGKITTEKTEYNYFTVVIDDTDLIVTITPKTGCIVGIYEEIIHLVGHDGSTYSVKAKFEVKTQLVEKPVADDTSFIYTGQPQTYTIVSNSAYKVTGNVQTDAGEYEVVISLVDIDNFEWSDKTTSDIVYKFNIAKADPVVSWPTGLIGVGGATLDSVTLETGFAWDNKDTVIACEDAQYGITYTPSDVDNYNVISSSINVYGNHTYGEPTYAWATDNSTCTATRVCSHDNTHTETENATAVSEVTQVKSCTTNELTKYTATFTNSAFETQLKENVKTADMLGHNYGVPTYVWSEDNSICTATRVCSHDNTHTETESINVVSVVTQAQSCTTDELTTHTATFTNSAFATQIKENVKTADMLGHNYGVPTYVWATDNSVCTATRVCSHDSAHTETENATVASEVTQAQSCTTDELTKYTATFTNSAFETQLKENVKTADMLGHDFANGVYVTDDEQHWKQCSRCDVQDTENKIAHSFVDDVCVCGYETTNLIWVIATLGCITLGEVVLILLKLLKRR